MSHGAERSLGTGASGQGLLGKLAELELEFFGRVNSLLQQQSIHGIDRCAEALLAGQFLHGLVAESMLSPWNPPEGAILLRSGVYHQRYYTSAEGSRGWRYGNRAARASG